MTLYKGLYSHIKERKFHILPITPAYDPAANDPFFVQFEAISRFIHLLLPLLSSLPLPLSAFFSDFVVAANVSHVV